MERRLVQVEKVVGEGNTVNTMMGRLLNYENKIDNMIRELAERAYVSAAKIAEAEIDRLERGRRNEITDQMIYMYLIRIYNELNRSSIQNVSMILNELSNYIAILKKHLQMINNNLDSAEASSWL